jgi:outer membrane protein assembly factor BamB
MLAVKRGRTIALVVAFVSLPPLLSAPLRAEDWPQWRGLNRDGACGEDGLLESFPAGGLKVRWRVPAGWGFSSPVVAQGRVFLADSEVVKPTAKERVRCFDATTGKTLWTHAHEVAYEDWAFDPSQEIGPVATPIVQSGKAYAVGRLGHLLCLDTSTGEVLWQRNLEQDYHAASAPGAPSPLIEGDLLILFIGGKPGACVVALHKDTGKEAWKALDESLTFSSPIVVQAGGKTQLIVWTQESVTSLDPAAGTTFWRQRLLTGGDYAVSTPVFHGNRLLIGGLMFQLDADKPAATVLWPASKAPAQRIYSHTSTPLFRGEHLFSAKSSGELVCVEASTGKQVWESTKVTDLHNGASIHLTPNGESVLLYTDKGELIRAQLSSLGYNEISRVAVLEPTFPFGGRKVAWSPPAYANRHIFARNGKELICASLAAATTADSPDQPATPEQQYRTQLQLYDDAFEQYARAFREAKSPEDQQKIIQEKYPRPDKWASTFLELAEKSPGEPFAEDALIWIVTNESRLTRFLPWHEHTARYEMIWISQLRSGFLGDKHEQDVRGNAIDLLMRDHVTSSKMSSVSRMLGVSRDPRSATLLRAILERNPGKEAKAEACLALFNDAQGRIALARQLRENPQFAKSVAPFYPGDYLEAMQKVDLSQLESEGEKLYAELTENHVLDMKSDRVIRLCQESKYSGDSEKLLRFLYQKDKRREVRGVACLILGQVLEQHANRLATSDPGGAGTMHKESETLLEVAAGEYADVEMPFEGPVGRKARSVLFDSRHLSVGDAAPEVSGVDQSGHPFKLSDYKGKVVLLDFWSEF